jgi:CRISPR-associated protein Cas5t
MIATHARLRGMTASFRHPLVITGFQMSLPLPPFSTLLGIISACSGRVIRPSEIKLGFSFRSSGQSTEMERTNRFEYAKGGLRPHHKGQSILQRQILLNPQLDLYVEGIGFLDSLRYPASTPSIGRSQDVAWIEFAREIQLEPSDRGRIGPTLLPESFSVPGLILMLAEWTENRELGTPRKIGAITKFKALSPYDANTYPVEGPGLWRPSDAETTDYVIHLHEWSTE